MDDEVWKLKIEKTGLSDTVLHESLHKNVMSAIEKSKSVLTYDVPPVDEWYERPNTDELPNEYIGYVLDRDEIDAWPIRIEAVRTDVLDLLDDE